MKTVRVILGHERDYNIRIGFNIAETLKDFLHELPIGKKAAVITNPKLRKLYGEGIKKQFTKAGFSTAFLELPAGERYKTLRSVSKIYDFLIQERFERNSAIIALGGGVTGDVAGFAAATYLRGIPYIQIPTSLVAQVDSSVGGKTGVDHPLGKNLIGAFYQPVFVWADVAVLTTLHRREFIAGMAEVIKYGVIADEEFFSFIEDNYRGILSLDPELLIHLVERSCEIKAEVVGQDEKEKGLRAILNFGHTIGHAIETVTGYNRYLHGEAVSIGMVYASKLGHIMGLCDKDVYKRLEMLCRQIGLQTSMPELNFDALMDVMQRDKKVVNGKIRFIIPAGIGKVEIIDDIEKEQLKEALQLCYSENKFV